MTLINMLRTTTAKINSNSGTPDAPGDDVFALHSSAAAAIRGGMPAPDPNQNSNDGDEGDEADEGEGF